VIERSFAVEQIERLRQLDWFPATPAGENELIFALMASQSELIAVSAINNWVCYSKECPKPAELRKFIWDENEKIKPAAPAPSRNHCKQCNGTGVRGGHIGTKQDSEWSACFCPLGDLESTAEKVRAANVARERILRVVTANAKLVVKRTSANDPMRSVEEVYRGSF
jgi:hypothetical protein